MSRRKASFLATSTSSLERNCPVGAVALQESSGLISLQVPGALVRVAEPKADASRRNRSPHYEEVEGQQLLSILRQSPSACRRDNFLFGSGWQRHHCAQARTVADINAGMTSALEPLQEGKKIKLHRGTSPVRKSTRSSF